MQSEVYPGNHFSPMLRFTSFLLFLLAICLPHPVTTTAVNFTQCMIDIRHLPPGTLGGLDSNGKPVDIANATAITYDLCINRCGTESEPFSWSVFSQQFGAWLLPWLALISQLPFGARHRSQNLMSVLLAVGSPTLAAYSLALTVLNGQWITSRFASYQYPNIRLAVRVLSSLQQAPLKITQEGLLASLIVLPENDNWWIELVDWLDYTHTWSISAASSIGWVVIAYIFTVVDSFTTVTNNINANGQGVGSVWLWLLPIVVGWLQISPKCDWTRLNIALNKANAIAHVAASSRGAHPIRADPISDRAFSLHQHPPHTIHEDEQCTAPIYNYARFFPWVQAVEEVASAFQYASNQARANRPVNPDAGWTKGSRQGDIHPANRVGSLDQVEAYCSAPPYVRRSRWGPGVWSRSLIAATLSILLQWGTAGAAVIVVWFTPTTGLGCRSGSYILYAGLSTLVWIMMVASSILAHYATFIPSDLQYHLPTNMSTRIAAVVSILLRRLGKLLATCNAIWIIAACIFQFSNVFNRCFCNSSVFGRGSSAFYTALLSSDDIPAMKSWWTGGVILALGSAFGFVGFVNLFIDPLLPD